MTLKIPSDTNIDTIYAKLRARRAAIFEKQRLLHLCELKGLPNLAAEIYPEQGIQSSRQFQKKLSDDHVADLLWIGDFLGEPEHAFFLWLMRRYQVENAKVLFRGFHARLGPSEVLPNLIKLPDVLELPAEKMITARDAAEFADAVHDDAIRRLVDEGTAAYKKKSKPFFFDAAVDRAYLAELISLSTNLDLDAGTKLIELEASIYLVMMAVRLKASYRVDFNDVAPFLQIPRAVPLEMLRRLYDAESVAAAVHLLPKRMAAALAGAHPATPEELERALMAHFQARAEATLAASGVALDAVVAFYYIRRIELANLIRLVEGYRYGLSPAELRKTLVPPE